MENNEAREPEEDNLEANQALSELLDAESDEDNQETEPLITEKMVSEFGLPKNMVGKPLSEYGKSHRNLRNELTQTKQQLSELSTQFSELSAKQQETIEKEVEEELGEEPDPLEDPKGYAKYVKKQLALTEKKIRDEVRSELEKEFEPIKKEKRAAEEAELAAIFKEQIGEDYEGIVAEWAKTENLTRTEVKYYLDNPKKLVKPVLNYFKAKEYDNLLTQREKGEQVVKKAKNRIAEDEYKVSRQLRNETANPVMKELLERL